MSPSKLAFKDSDDEARPRRRRRPARRRAAGMQDSAVCAACRPPGEAGSTGGGAGPARTAPAGRCGGRSARPALRNPRQPPIGNIYVAFNWADRAAGFRGPGSSNRARAGAMIADPDHSAPVEPVLQLPWPAACKILVRLHRKLRRRGLRRPLSDCQHAHYPLPSGKGQAITPFEIAILFAIVDVGSEHFRASGSPSWTAVRSRSVAAPTFFRTGPKSKISIDVISLHIPSLRWARAAGRLPASKTTLVSVKLP